MKTLTVVNPNSSNHNTGKIWPQIHISLKNTIGRFDVAFTKHVSHATQITQDALAQGYERIIAVGGDGTYNEIVNGFFDDQQVTHPNVHLGLIPCGTGGDLRKTLGIGISLADCLPVLQGNHVQKVDLGRVWFTDVQGNQAMRHFINITSFGIGGLVDRLVNQSSKAFGGKVSFLIGTVKAIVSYRNQAVRLKVDQTFEQTLTVNNIAVANGQYFGGGMWVAPHAKIDDGLFDVVILGDFSKLDLIRDGTKIYNGRHLENKKVQSLQGRVVEAHPQEPTQEVLIDMDGEHIGRLPARLEIIPKAISVIVPAS